MFDVVPNGHYNKGISTNALKEKIMNHTDSKMIFSLAGELVSDAVDAKRILVDAIKTGKEWLAPQAESVLRQLRAQA